MKKLPFGIRFLLGLISFLLCIPLFVSTLCAAVLGDLNLVFQKDNLQKMFSEALFSSVSTRHPAPHGAASGHGGPAVQQFPVKLDDFTMPEGDFTIPDFIGAGGENSTSAMVEWIYGTLADQFEDVELPPLETVQTFVEESTVTDFLADKTSSIISDLFTGENTTTITTEEIQTLLEDNAQLIEDTFGLEMDEEVISQVVTMVEENEVVQAIQKEGVSSIVEDLVSNGVMDLPEGLLPVPGLNGDPGAEENSPMSLINTLRSYVSMGALMSVIGVCLVLIALLLLVNIKQIWVGIKDAGVTILIAGVILMIPTCLLWAAGDVLDSLLYDAGPVASIIKYILKSTAPIHVGIFAGGIVLIVVSCVLKGILRKRAIAKAAAVAAAAKVPAVEAPAAEETVAEEASAEEVPAEEVPAAEEPIAEEPVVEAPVAEEAPAQEQAPAEPV